MSTNWVEQALQSQIQSNRRSPVVGLPAPVAPRALPAKPRLARAGRHVAGRTSILALLLSVVMVIGVSLPQPPVSAASWLPGGGTERAAYAYGVAGTLDLPEGIREIRAAGSVVVVTTGPRWGSLREADRAEILVELASRLEPGGQLFAFSSSGRPAGSCRAGVAEVYP